MDAPPIPRFVDLVHAFKGVVVEQVKKRVEKLLSDSILLWLLLKLLFKILHQAIDQLFEIFSITNEKGVPQPNFWENLNGRVG